MRAVSLSHTLPLHFGQFAAVALFVGCVAGECNCAAVIGSTVDNFISFELDT